MKLFMRTIIETHASRKKPMRLADHQSVLAKAFGTEINPVSAKFPPPWDEESAIFSAQLKDSAKVYALKPHESENVALDSCGFTLLIICQDETPDAESCVNNLAKRTRRLKCPNKPWLDQSNTFFVYPIADGTIKDSEDYLIAKLKKPKPNKVKVVINVCLFIASLVLLIFSIAAPFAHSFELFTLIGGAFLAGIIDVAADRFNNVLTLDVTETIRLAENIAATKNRTEKLKQEYTKPVQLLTHSRDRKDHD